MDEKLSDGWVWTTLGEISTKPQYGWTTKAKFTQGSVLLLRTTDITSGMIDWNSVPYCTEVPENLADYVLEVGDIVISRAGSVGFSYLLKDIPRPTVFASYLIRFHPLQGAEPQYIAYYLQTSEYWNRIYEESRGIALANVNARKLETIEIPLAPLPEQHRIVAAIEQQFTRLDNAVASLQSARTRAKQYRASLLKAAVEGELTKEWRAGHPTEETGEQLLARILTERRALWEEEQLAKMRERGSVPEDDKWKRKYEEPQGPDIEQLPELPEGWCWATLEQIITFLRNGLPQKPEASPPGYRILRINAVRPMKVDLDEVRYLPLSEEEARDYIIDNGDILFTRYNGSRDLLGVAGVVKGCFEPTLHPDKLIRAKTVLRDPLPLYIEIACNVGISRAFIESRARTTAGQTGISGSDLRQVPVPLPPLSEQAQIVAEVEARLSNIAKMEETIEASLKRAEHERQSILREAFAGRLVPQNPEDEPATVLLERIRAERKQREENEKIARSSRKGIQMAIAKKRRAGKVGLYETLVESGHLPPDDLFKRAGLKTDEQPESVEVFYEELDADVEDKLVAERRPDYETVLLEALEPSAEMRARMAQAEPAGQAQETGHNEETLDAPTLWNT